MKRTYFRTTTSEESAERRSSEKQQASRLLFSTDATADGFQEEDLAQPPLSWRDDPSVSLSDWTIVATAPEEEDQISRTTTTTTTTTTTRTYHVHRAILGAGSRKCQYFCSLFQQQQQQSLLSCREHESNTSQIEFQSQDELDGLESLLDFLYSGGVYTAAAAIGSNDNAVIGRHLAFYFQCSAFMKQVNLYIAQDLTTDQPNRCVWYLIQATNYSDDRLIQSATTLCARSLPDVTDLHLLASLSTGLFQSVLESPDLQCSSRVLSCKVNDYLCSIQLPGITELLSEPIINNNNNMSLTYGAVTTMVRGADDYKPTVQIINLKSVGPQGDRFRIVISDGEHYCTGMLATELNNTVNAGQIKENSIVKVTDFMTNTVQDRVVVIVLKLEVVVGEHDGRIGLPTDIIEKTNIAEAAKPADQPMDYRTNNATSTTNNPYDAKSAKQEQTSANNNNNTNNKSIITARLLYDCTNPTIMPEVDAIPARGFLRLIKTLDSTASTKDWSLIHNLAKRCTDAIALEGYKSIKVDQLEHDFGKSWHDYGSWHQTSDFALLAMSSALSRAQEVCTMQEWEIENLKNELEQTRRCCRSESPDALWSPNVLNALDATIEETVVDTLGEYMRDHEHWSQQQSASSPPPNAAPGEWRPSIADPSSRIRSHAMGSQRQYR